MPKKLRHQTAKSYLDRLTFRPELTKSLIYSYIGNLRLVILAVIMIFAVGIYSFINLPKRLNPELDIPIVSIIAILPGAPPEDIESLLTIPIENTVKNLADIDSITSVSNENFSATSIQFRSGVSSEKAKNDVQSVIDGLDNLPVNAQAPKVTALDFENQPVWTFTVIGQTDFGSLTRFVNELKKRLSETPKIDRTEIAGTEEEEIAVTFTPESLTTYSLNPAVLSQIVKSALTAFPAGLTNTTDFDFAVSIDPEIRTIEDIRQLKVSLGSGQTVRLGEIAQVEYRPKPDQKRALFADKNSPPQQAVSVSVYKSKTANIDEARSAAGTMVDRLLKEYPGQFTVKTVSDTAFEIDTQFRDLVGEFRSTIILIIGCLFVFLGLKQALISSFTVPLTFLSAFAIMKLMGMSINFLSLFAILLTLGLLIDDTIVVVSAMTTYYKTRKFTPRETGILVWNDVIIPIWSTTITTVWSFAPLLLSSGIIGEFIKPIPIVVTAVMLSSTAIATLITLPFMTAILKPRIPKRVATAALIGLVLTGFGAILVFLNDSLLLLPAVIFFGIFLWIVRLTIKKVVTAIEKRLKNNLLFVSLFRFFRQTSEHGLVAIEPVGKAYYRLITRVLSSGSARKKVLVTIIAYSVWAFSLLPLGLVKNEFFPKTDSEIFYVNLELPAGSRLSNLEEDVTKITNELRTIPEADFVAATTGTTFSGSFRGSRNQGNSAVFSVHLSPEEKRSRSSIAIAESVRKQYENYSRGKITVTEVSGGPPAGADIAVNILGPELAELDRLADEMMSYLKNLPGLTAVEKSILPGTSKLSFIPDPDKLSDLGLTRDMIGLWLRTYSSGFTLSEVNFDKTNEETTDITFRIGKTIPAADAVFNLAVPTLTGQIVPLSAAGRVEAVANPTTITRDGGKRTIAVTATVRPGFNISEINSRFTGFQKTISLPEGYEFTTGGVNEENQKSVQSILAAMGLAFLLILVTMVVQFQSYRQAVIVLLVIPLAVSSVFVAFAATGTPLSFPSLIGILSLFGIVVTNSMFIVDKINLNRREGMSFVESIADAGESRLEPIVLTKLATVLGLLPITIADPLWRGLGGAIISGVLIASTIMLLFIPVVYYEWFKGDN